jgi:hypothetical protein
VIPVGVDYLGFDIPDLWVVGYGLDHDDRWRNLPYIGVLDPAQLRSTATDRPLTNHPARLSSRGHASSERGV